MHIECWVLARPWLWQGEVNLKMRSMVSGQAEGEAVAYRPSLSSSLLLLHILTQTSLGLFWASRLSHPFSEGPPVSHLPASLTELAHYESLTHKAWLTLPLPLSLLPAAAKVYSMLVLFLFSQTAPKLSSSFQKQANEKNQ